MKSSIILIVGLLFILAGAFAQDSLSHHPFISINGDPVHLSAYEGKKFLFVVLPAAVSDTTVAGQIGRLQQRYDSSVLIIVGVAALDHGYDVGQGEALRALYATPVQKGLVLTRGVNVSRISGSGQAGFMQWLTDKDLNGHYNEDADQEGKKFIVSASGALYGVLGNETSLDDPLMDIILGGGMGN